LRRFHQRPNNMRAVAAEFQRAGHALQTPTSQRRTPFQHRSNTPRDCVKALVRRLLPPLRGCYKAGTLRGRGEAPPLLI